MPINYAGSTSPHDIDPRRWERCQREVASAMIADGWPPKAGKFREVCMRRARKLFYKP